MSNMLPESQLDPARKYVIIGFDQLETTVRVIMFDGTAIRLWSILSVLRDRVLRNA